MSHEIKERDVQAGRAQAWHGLTTVVDVVTREVAHPYEIEVVRLMTENGQSTDYRMLVASDDKLPIGKAFTDSYVPNTIEGFWNVIESAFKGVKYTVESAGSIMNRDRIFASISIDGGFKVGKREFKGFINLLDSFDHVTTFEGHYSNICVVCANTFAFSMSQADSLLQTGEGFRARAKHSKNFNANLVIASAAIEGFVTVQDGYKKHLANMASTPISKDDARFFLAGFIGGEKEVLSTRSQNIIERLTALFNDGAGNEGKNLLDIFSAVTDYYTHESAGGNEANRTLDQIAKKQFESSEFGNGRTRKEQAFRLLSVEKDIKAAIKAGKAVIRATEKAAKESAKAS